MLTFYFLMVNLRKNLTTKIALLCHSENLNYGSLSFKMNIIKYCLFINLLRLNKGKIKILTFSCISKYMGNIIHFMYISYYEIGLTLT